MFQRPRLRFASIALGALGAAYAALVVSACSGDDTTPPNATADSSVPADATIDNTQPSQDTGAGGDTSTQDTGKGGDTGTTNKCLGAIDAASLDDAMVAEGMQAVLAFRCYGCHQSTPVDAGITLSGNNNSIKDGGAVYPPNLTPDPDSGLGCWTLDQIGYTILNAIDDQDASLCVMPKFATKGMDASTAQAVAEFLKSLPAVQNQVPQTTCPPVPEGGTDAGDAGDADDASDAPADG
jgi:hypothetical protein